MTRHIKHLLTAYSVLILIACIAMEIAKEVPPSYRASATLLVDHKYRHLKNEDQLEQPIISMEDETRTVAETLPRRDLMRQIIISHDLLSNDVFAGSHNGPQKLDTLANQLASSLNSRVKEGTRLVNVSLTYKDRELTPFLLNLIVQEYINQQYDLSLDSNRYARTLLTNETGLLKFKLGESETALLEFRRTNHLIRPFAEHRQQLVQQLDRLEKKEATKHREIALIEKQLAEIKAAGQSPSPSALRQVTGLLDTPELQRLEKRRTEQEWIVTRLSSSHGSIHPMVALEHQMLEAIEDLMTPLLRARRRAVATRRKDLDQELSVITRRIELTKARIESTDQLAPQYKALEREIQSRLALYDASLYRLRESNLTEGIEERVISVVESATDVHDVTPTPFSRFIKSSSLGILLGFVPVFVLKRTWRFLDRVFRWSSSAQPKPSLSAPAENK